MKTFLILVVFGALIWLGVYIAKHDNIEPKDKGHTVYYPDHATGNKFIVEYD